MTPHRAFGDLGVQPLAAHIILLLTNLEALHRWIVMIKTQGKGVIGMATAVRVFAATGDLDPVDIGVDLALGPLGVFQVLGLVVVRPPPILRPGTPGVKTTTVPRVGTETILILPVMTLVSPLLSFRAHG
jgi:hypothetical protein